MGQFSWVYSDTLRPVLDNVAARTYLLNPFGDSYKESCYDGYGRFGGYDVYDLVTDWNKPFLNKKMLRKPKKSKYEDNSYFKKALEWYEYSAQRIRDFKKMSEEQMLEKYGNCYKREIGIDIACYDNQNFSLPYPIKITKKDMPYESAYPSISDSEQGWGWSGRDKSRNEEAFKKAVAERGLFKIKNIKWDTDGSKKALASLPESIVLPNICFESYCKENHQMYEDTEELLAIVSDWLSEEYEYCHDGFEVESLKEKGEC